MRTRLWCVVLRCAHAIEREMKLIAAFAPTPSGVQPEIDLAAWQPRSRTDAPPLADGRLELEIDRRGRVGPQPRDDVPEI